MQNHIDTVQKIYAAFGAGDISTILGQLADDVDWESWADHSGLKANIPWFRHRRGVPGGGRYRDEEIHLWTFNADGKVTRLRHYLDTVKLIEAARNWPPQLQ